MIRAFCLPYSFTTYWAFWAVKNQPQLKRAANRAMMPVMAKIKKKTHTTFFYLAISEIILTFAVEQMFISEEMAKRFVQN